VAKDMRAIGADGDVFGPGPAGAKPAPPPPSTAAAPPTGILGEESVSSMMPAVLAAYTRAAAPDEPNLELLRRFCYFAETWLAQMVVGISELDTGLALVTRDQMELLLVPANITVDNLQDGLDGLYNSESVKLLRGAERRQPPAAQSVY
jgi:hypothetical protein